MILCERARRITSTHCRLVQSFRQHDSVPAELTSASKRWVRKAVCKIQAMCVHTVVYCSLWPKMLHLPTSSQLGRMRILTRVSSFLDRHHQSNPVHFGDNLAVLRESKNLPVNGVYQVNLTELQALRRTRSRSKASGLKDIRTGNVVLWNSICVEVVAVRLDIDAAQVTSTIGMHKWFAMGAGSSAPSAPTGAGFSAPTRPMRAGSSAPSASRPRIAWRAARILHRCSLLMSPDAACESIGSWMRYKWNPRRGMTPRDVADAVHLAQAGVRCIGGARDEALVTEVARLLRETSRYGNVSSSRQLTLMQQRIQEHDQWLQDSGRGCNFDSHVLEDPLRGINSAEAQRQAIRKRARATEELPSAMFNAVTNSVDTLGRVEVLQMDVMHLHARQRGATHSVMQERLHAWMTTDAGQAWKKERGLLLQADDNV